MENQKTFKTKTGHCHITSEQIILSRGNKIGKL